MKGQMRRRSRPGNWSILAGAIVASAMLGGTLPAQAACDANTTGVSVCSGTDATVTKIATGNLDVPFNNETVTTGGVTISGGAGGFNVDLNVTSASGPNPIANTGAGNGIDISSNGGNVAVTTISGATVTSNAIGINSSVTGGSGNTAITFNAGISAITAGVQAISSSTGSMTVTGSGNIGFTDHAITVQNNAATTSGDLTINTSGNYTGVITAQVTQAANNANISVTHTGTINNAGSSITATTAGGGNVAVTTTQLLQTGGVGINAQTVTGGITIHSGAITTTGGGNGINATVTGGGTGGVAITTNGVITSNGIGINSSVTGGSGNTAITFNAGISAITAGVQAISSSTGSMTVTGSGNIGFTDHAITVQNNAATTSGDLTINTSGNYTGVITAQVTQAANNANISVTHTGTINNAGSSITATTAGGGNVAVTTTQLLQTGGVGINAQTVTGGITIHSGAITTTGGGNGINATVTGGGTGGVAITTNGVITSNGIGINSSVTGGSGNTAITTNAAVNALASNGIVAHTTGTGSIAVNVNAPVTAGVFGLDLLGGTTKTVTNSSTISGTVTGINADRVNVTNLGAITGSTGIHTSAAASSVFTSGAITGTGGTAVLFSGPANTFTLGPGFAVNGLVLGVAGDTFQLGGSGTSSFDASLVGPAAQYRNFGVFNKVGDSTWTLTGTNALALPWTVQQGILNVAGSLPNSPFTVNAGGTLGGNGIVGNTVINGGVLSPGNSIGLLTVQGNLVFTAASSYMIEVSPSAADRTNVTGTATLGGATVNTSFAAGTYVAKQYTILNAAGGVSGTFAGPVNSNLPQGFHSSLSYDANDAFLNLLLNFVPPPGTGLSGNQQNVGNAIINFFNTTGGIPIVFGGLTPAGLSQLSGEVATGSQQTTFNAMGLFMGLLTDPFVAGRGDPVSAGASAGTSAYTSQDKPRAGAERDAYAAIYRKAPVMADPFVQRWSVWAAGYGGSQTTDGNAALGSNNTTSRIAGGVVGADYRFSPFTLAGFALAGGGTNFSISNGLGSGRSDLFQAGAFVRHTVGPAYLSAALAYGWQDITTDRTVTIAGVDQLRAKFNANAWSGRVEGGYRFVTPWMGLTPYAAGQFTTFDLPAYAEQAVVGANTFALAYGSKSVTASRSELGLRTDNSWAMQDGIFTVRGRFAWAHDFNIDRIVGPTFQTLPGASFVVNGAAQAHDSALVTASAEKKWLTGWSTAATFEGEFSNVTRSYAGKGVVRYSW